jgi:hypothetical protein
MSSESLLKEDIEIVDVMVRALSNQVFDHIAVATKFEDAF